MKISVRHIFAALALGAAATAQSAPLFSDNFDDGDAAGWTFHGINQSSWNVAGGQLLHGGGYTGQASYALIDGVVTPQHFSLEADVRVNANQFGRPDWGHVGLIWGVNTTSGNFNTAYLRTHWDHVTNWSVPYGSGERLLSTPGTNNGSTYHLAVSVNYDTQTMSVSLDSQSITFTGADFAAINQNTGGGIGLISWSDDVTYDNIVLNALPVPEPETYALLLAGLGLVGGVARRRARS
ncbi:MAG: PEP-CTERM sorting domain-containing protein [Rhodocyclaceae bacterium]|nr:PEP-CTERM sorting domain-containing protein [Rhodocyclaceae bacterium]